MKARTIQKLAFVGLVLAGGVFFARRHHVLARFEGRRDVLTVELKKQPFVKRVVADGYLRAVQSTPLTVPSEARGPQKIAWMVADGSKVSKGDVVVRFDPSEFEKKLQDGRSDEASAGVKIDKERSLADSAGRDRTRAIELSQSELDASRAFQQKDPEIFSRNEIISSALDERLSTTRMKHDREASVIEGALSKNKIDLLAIEKRAAGLRVARAEQALHSLEIRAPHDGIIVFELDYHGKIPHVGDSVWSGETLATLPDLGAMEAEAFVLELDAGGLAVGNAASVVLEAHPEAPFEGKIKHIDALPKPRVRDVTTLYFSVIVSLASTSPDLIKVGERVRVTLTVNGDDALLAPRQSVFDKGGKTLAYRLHDGRFDPVEIKLGGSTSTFVAIEEGLAEGDRVALWDPTAPIDEAQIPDAQGPKTSNTASPEGP